MTYRKTQLPIHTLLSGMVVFFLLLSGCQEPIEIIDPIDTETTFDNQSDLFELLYKVTLLDGSLDNILDDGSCVQVILPVDLAFGTETFTIASQDDFQTLAIKMSTMGLSTEELVFQYPIKIKTSHYELLTVSNRDELEEYTDECIRDGSDMDIECVDLVYPIDLTTYNKLTEESSSETVDSDADFHGFLKNMSSDDLVSFDFPVSLISYEGTDLIASANSELVTTLSSFESACDEQDDIEFDFEVDLQFIEWLIQNDWYIHHFYDKTQLYPELRALKISFKEDGTIYLDSEITDNSWSVYEFEDDLELQLSFTDEPLTLANVNWMVAAYTEEKIVLKKSEADDSENHYLILSTVPKTIFNDFESTLSGSAWQIDVFTRNTEEDSEDISEDSIEYVLLFKDDGGLVIEYQEERLEGVWFSIFEESLVINIEESEIDDLNREWKIISFNGDQVALEYLEDEEQTLSLVLIPL